MSLTAHVIADLEFVAAYWPDLVEQRLPGTARPWRQPDLSPEQRAERDHAARIERLERTDDAWGETPAPVDVSVLDLMADIVWDADDVAGIVADAIMCPRLAPPPTAYSDPRPWLDFAARHVSAMGSETAYRIASVVRGMVDAIARALCLVYDGQRLDVVCPWCAGRTEVAPVGGAYLARPATPRRPGRDRVRGHLRAAQQVGRDVVAWATVLARRRVGLAGQAGDYERGTRKDCVVTGANMRDEVQVLLTVGYQAELIKDDRCAGDGVGEHL